MVFGVEADSAVFTVHASGNKEKGGESELEMDKEDFACCWRSAPLVFLP